MDHGANGPVFPCENTWSTRDPANLGFLGLGRCPDWCWCPETDGIPDLAAPALPRK
jgi:hypothetical protein